MSEKIRRETIDIVDSSVNLKSPKPGFFAFLIPSELFGTESEDFLMFRVKSWDILHKLHHNRNPKRLFIPDELYMLHFQALYSLYIQTATSDTTADLFRWQPHRPTSALDFIPEELESITDMDKSSLYCIKLHINCRWSSLLAFKKASEISVVPVSVLYNLKQGRFRGLQVY